MAPRVEPDVAQVAALGQTVGDARPRGPGDDGGRERARPDEVAAEGGEGREGRRDGEGRGRRRRRRRGRGAAVRASTSAGVRVANSRASRPRRGGRDVKERR